MLERKSHRADLPFWLAVSLMIVLMTAAPAPAQKAPAAAVAPPTAPGELTKLADGVYAQVVNPDSDAVSNSGVVILDSGVLIFDTHFTPEAGEALLEKVKAATPRPVRYVVDSHFHPDHTHGNQAFATARQIIGSTNTRRDMLQKDLPALNQAQTIAQNQVEQLSKEISQERDAKRQESLRAQLTQRLAFMRRMSGLRILAPGMTLDDSLSIVDGPREVQLLSLGIGHTDGDIVLYLPQEKIIFLGDLFFNDSLPNVEDANMLEWIKTLKEALKLDAKTFVPGHGQVGTRADVEEFVTYLEDLKTLVEPAVTRGDTLEQVIHELRLPSKYASYSFQDFFPANLQKMYTELKVSQSEKPQQEGVKKRGLHS